MITITWAGERMNLASPFGVIKTSSPELHTLLHEIFRNGPSEITLADLVLPYIEKQAAKAHRAQERRGAKA